MAESGRLVRIIKRAGVFRPGEVFSTTAGTAAMYVSRGIAEYLDDGAPEAAVVEPPERAVMPRPRPRKR